MFWRGWHERIHTGGKPFSCSKCGYKCTRLFVMLTSSCVNIKQFFKSHPWTYPLGRHPSAALKQVIWNFERHEAIHTGDKPFSCSQCGYKCTSLFVIMEHERTNTGDKSFNCSQCKYKWCPTSSNFKSLERTHVGKKPFSCEKSSLKKNEWIHRLHWWVACIVTTDAQHQAIWRHIE